MDNLTELVKKEKIEVDHEESEQKAKYGDDL